MWTLTQTDDLLWYHVYTNQKKQGGGDHKRTTASVQEENRAEERYEPPAVTDEKQSTMEAEMLRDYFQLHVKMEDLYKQWGAADSHFKKTADVFTGKCKFD